MPVVLVSGAHGLVAAVTAQLRLLGADVHEVLDPLELPDVCKAAGAGSFDAYIQLPVALASEGDTAIERVRHFYADGVLARFPALNAALPSLNERARLVLVVGALPADAATQQDAAARRALTEVLAHAARADRVGTQLSVDLLDMAEGAERIAQVATGEVGAARPLPETEAGYADWRTEVLGLAMIEI